MIFGLKVARLIGATVFIAGGFAACTAPEVERICPALPQVRFTPDPERTYGVKDNLSVNLTPFHTDGGDFFACPAMVCFTVDGSDPQKGRAATHCYPGPIKQVPMPPGKTCFNYYVIGTDGSQSTTREVCYNIEPPPVSTCTPKSKASREPINVELTSNKEGTIFYTDDGSDPDPDGDSSGSTKSGSAKVSIKLETSRTIKFRAQDSVGNLEEKTNSCDYKVDGQPPETVADPAGKSSASAFVVTITSNEAASIYYTTDGSTPLPARLDPVGTTRSEFFEANVNISESTYLRFFAIDGVGNEEDPVNEEIYFIGGKPAVKLDPGPGGFAETSISISMAAQGAAGEPVEIWYTTDKSTPVRNGAGSRLYAAAITDFSIAGEHTLKYIAYSNPGLAGEKSTGVKTALYDLGQVAQPFFKQINFTDATQYDDVKSDKTIEMNTNKGIARLRRKIPVKIGSGIPVDAGGTAISGFAVPNQSLPQQVQIRRVGSTDLLHFASGNEFRVYNISNPAVPSHLSAMRETTPANRFGAPCSTTQLNGLFLGLNYYVADDSSSHVMAPFTSLAGNCGGFANYTMTYSSDTTRPYFKTDLTQFGDDPQVDPPFSDIEEINDASDPVLPNLPKSDSEIVSVGGDTLLLQPLYRSGYYLDAFYAANGAPAITSAVNFAGRALAVESDVISGITAVGDSTGQLYTLMTNTLTAGAGTASIAIPCATACRVNELAWYRSGIQTFVIMALGYYGETVTGQVAVAEIDGNGSITLKSAAALPASDDYQFDASVEAIRIVGTLGNEFAVVAVKEQGVVLMSLANIATTGKLSSLGYITGRDIADTSFWAVDIEPFPAVISTSKFAVIDAGRTNTTLHAGVQIFDALNVTKFETDGAFYTTNLNSSGKAISRVGLDSALPDPFPNGLTITLVADGVEVASPLNIGIEHTFSEPMPTDVRAKITFASPDSGATELKIDYLKFKFSPVE